MCASSLNRHAVKKKSSSNCTAGFAHLLPWPKRSTKSALKLETKTTVPRLADPQYQINSVVEIGKKEIGGVRLSALGHGRLSSTSEI